MIASLVARRAWRRFVSACDDPLAAQADCLRRVLAGAATTTFGRAHGFGALSRLRDAGALIRAWQDAVPVRTHAEMKADLDAVYRGDWRHLCPTPPLYFSMTAGSTGAYKYVPVTAAYRRGVRRAAHIFAGALETAYPSVRGLRTQFLVGSAEGGRSPAGIPQGFASGFNYRHLPALLRRRFVLPYWIFTLGDAEERAYAAGRMLADAEDLGVLCAISPVNLINLREALERQSARLLADIERGTYEPRGTSAVAGQWRTRPRPDRAATLRRALALHGALPTPLLFPRLRVLVCWMGGNMSYYLPELRRAFGIAECFEFPNSASEAVFAIPFAPNTAGGALAVTSHFMEFLPAEGGAARGLRADELEPGEQYRIVVTTAAGFYRYDMEDIVRVIGALRRTPVIEFVCKQGRRVSVSNERITERDVTVAMQAACAECGAWYPAFLFVPCSDRRYRVVLDGAAPAAADDAALRRLAQALERHLRAAATGYDFEREDALLEPLEVVVTAPGELAAWLAARRGGQELPNAQLKPAHLTTQFDAHRAFTEARRYAA